MKDDQEQRYQELLAHWVTESLTSRQTDELLALVAADPKRRKDLGRQRLVERALQLVHDTDPVLIAAEVRYRLNPRDSGRRFNQGAQRRIQRARHRQHRRSWLSLTAAAAAVLVVFLAVLAINGGQSKQTGNHPDVLVMEDVPVLRLDRGQALSPTGNMLVAGDQLAVGQEFVVRGDEAIALTMLDSGYHITFAADSRVNLIAGGLYLFYGQGDVTSREGVAHPASFVLQTPHAVVQPIGTRFRVESEAAHTDVALYSGEVRVRNRSGHERVLHQPSHVRIHADGSFLQLPAAESEAVGAVIDDFSGMMTQRGYDHDPLEMSLVERSDGDGLAMRLSYVPDAANMAQLQLKMDESLPETARLLHLDVLVEDHDPRAVITIGVFDRDNNFWLLDEFELRDFESGQWQELRVDLRDRHRQTWTNDGGEKIDKLSVERIIGVTVTLKQQSATVQIDNLRWSGVQE